MHRPSRHARALHIHAEAIANPLQIFLSDGVALQELGVRLRG
jgi:hypothetical protein